MRRYYPKRPVKSFQDLEVYQKTYGLAIEVVRRVLSAGERPAAEIARSSGKQEPNPRKGRNVKDKKMLALGRPNGLPRVGGITKKLIGRVLRLPVLIATAHSIRFGDPERAITTLEEAMLSCNLAVVYLEQYRDLVNLAVPGRGDEIEHDFFEEQIKGYLRVRGKIMRLQKSWLRFMKEKEKKEKGE